VTPTKIYYGRDKLPSTTRSPWRDLLQSTLPSNPFYDPSFQKFEYAFEHGIYSLMLKHGADPSATVVHPPLQYTTAWIWFAFRSFWIVPTSPYKAHYLQNLDEFIAAGASLMVPLPASNLYRDCTQLFRLRSLFR
jgi:hypothetical protein